MEQAFSLVLANLQDGLRDLLAGLPFLAIALLVVGAFYLAGRVVRRLVRVALRRHDPTLAHMLAGLAFAAVLTLGMMTALWIVIPTFNFREIFTSLGVTGLILGFALRDLLENFVAGILILWRRPFRVGDQIRSGSHEGTVAEINFRSTVLQTYDGIKVYVPNGKVFTEPLQNMTGYPERRTTVVLGIDQQASVARARAVILAALRDVDGVLPALAPAVFFDAVGDFTNNLHVLYWTRPPTRMSELETRSAVTERLYTALQEAGVGFPYPIRTVQLASSPNGEHRERQPTTAPDADGR